MGNDADNQAIWLHYHSKYSSHHLLGCLTRIRSGNDSFFCDAMLKKFKFQTNSRQKRHALEILSTSKDESLADVILPALKQLFETKAIFRKVFFSDMCQTLRSFQASILIKLHLWPKSYQKLKTYNSDLVGTLLGIIVKWIFWLIAYTILPPMPAPRVYFF